jgi:hypothetical protein
MKHKRHLDQDNQSREALKTLVSDIQRVVQILTSDIAVEEEKAGVFSLSEAEYPMLARTLVARRDNLQETVAALRKRLSDLPAYMVEA